MKRKLLDIVSAVVITFAATCFIAVALLRPEWLLSVWFVCPLVSVASLIVGMLLQRHLDRKAFKKVCKNLRAKQTRLKDENHEFARQIEEFNRQVITLTNERNTLKESLEKRTADKRGKEILATLEGLSNTATPPVPMPSKESETYDIVDTLSELSGE